MVSEVTKTLSDINNSIAKWRETNVQLPKHLVLTLAQRHAIKITSGITTFQNSEDYREVVSFLDIPVIKAEETLIVNGTYPHDIVARVYDALAAEYKATQETGLSKEVMTLRQSRYQLLKALVEGK